MDAREQPPVAPGRASVDARAQDGPLRPRAGRAAPRRASPAPRRPGRAPRAGRAAPPSGRAIASTANQRSPSRTTRPAAAQLVEPALPRARLVDRHVAHPEQRLVHLLGVLRARATPPRARARSRRGRARRASSAACGSSTRARHHRLRAPLLERRVVEERVGLAGEDPARERRGLGRVDRAPLDAAVAQPAQHLEEAVHVHRLGEAVLDRLAHDRVLPRHRQIGPPGSVSGQASACGNAAASRSSARMRRSGGGDALAVARALEQQRALRVPAPARAEHRRGEQRLHQQVARRRRVQVVEDLLEREAVLRPEREDDRLLVGRRLQLEAEADAEALAQREAPGAVDARRRTARAPRAACRPTRRRSARAPRAAAWARRRARAVPRSRTRRSGRRRRRAVRPRTRNAGRRRRRPADRRHRQCASAHASRSSAIAADSSRVRAGASPSQNGSVGGWPFASATRTMPGSTRRMRQDALPSWKMSPPFDSIAKSSFDRADERALGLEHGPGSRAVSGIAPPDVKRGDRARGASRAASVPTPSRWSSARRPPPVCSAHDLVELLALERRGTARRGGGSRRAAPRPRSRADARGHDLLREDVERPGRQRRAVEQAAADATHERGRLDELVDA